MLLAYVPLVTEMNEEHFFNFVHKLEQVCSQITSSREKSYLENKLNLFLLSYNISACF